MYCHVMANPLPPGTIPKISRLKRAGKEVGSYGCLVQGKRVNLRTLDYAEARRRAKLAIETGQLDFPDSSREPIVNADNPAPSVPLLPALPPVQGGNWAAEVASAVAGVDDTPPPPPPETNAAQPDAYAPPGQEAPKEDPDSESTELDPEMLEEATEMVANILVEAQLWGQEWIARRWAKVQLGPVPQNHRSRKISVKCWKKALEQLLPEKIPIPPWAAAIITVGSYGLMEQVKGAQPLPDENQGPPVGTPQ